MAEAPPRFYYDYVDPLSLIVEHDLSALERAGWTRVTRSPLELRAPPADLIHADAPLWVSRWEQALSLGKARGLAFRPPDLVPWSRKAHELALHAREKNRFQAMHAALFRAYLEEGRDIGRVDVLASLAAEVELDREEVKTVLGVDRHVTTLDQLRAEAERLGVRGVPTLVVAGERIEGVLPAEALKALLASG